MRSSAGCRRLPGSRSSTRLPNASSRANFCSGVSSLLGSAASGIGKNPVAPRWNREVYSSGLTFGPRNTPTPPPSLTNFSRFFTAASLSVGTFIR